MLILCVILFVAINIITVRVLISEKKTLSLMYSPSYCPQKIMLLFLFSVNHEFSWVIFGLLIWFCNVFLSFKLQNYFVVLNNINEHNIWVCTDMRASSDSVLIFVCSYFYLKELVLRVWNDLRDWQNFHFWVNDPRKIISLVWILYERNEELKPYFLSCTTRISGFRVKSKQFHMKKIL